MAKTKTTAYIPLCISLFFDQHDDVAEVREEHALRSPRCWWRGSLVQAHGDSHGTLIPFVSLDFTPHSLRG